MISSITKAKIPTKYGFVLKTKQFEDLLKINEINVHIDLHYVYSTQNIGSIFEALFWLPNDNVPYNRLYIKAGVLSKEEIHQAREKMKEIVLPEFITWIKSILVLPNNSGYNKHNSFFFAKYNDNKLEINKIIK